MLKKKLLLVCAIISTLIACAGSPPAPLDFLNYVPKTPDAQSDFSPQPVSGKTAIEYFRDEKIYAGWNLGNTLDSYSSGNIGGESVWGNPRVNQELMNGVKAAGFDIIRIPVTWMGSFGPEPDYRIMPDRIKRVAEVVEMAHNAGLKVIINLFHDGSTQSVIKEIGWLSVDKASRNKDEYNRITAQFARVWKQIALYFKNYGDWLIFESFNELHDGSWGSGNDPMQVITLNKWTQLFTDIVRSTGGNNETRYLMVAAYCNDPKQALSQYFTLPNDSAADRLIVSFHYYDPHELGVQGTRYIWGTPEDKQRVEDDFAPFKERYIDKNIPVIIGECGAVLQLYPNNQAREAQARQSRLEYVSYVNGAAKKYGLVPIYWDNGSVRGNGEKFGLFDRGNGRPNSPESEALIKSMINAVK